MPKNNKNLLFLSIFLIFLCEFAHSACTPSLCKNKCCLNDECVNDILKCPLKTNKNFDALIASLSIVAFFTIGI